MESSPGSELSAGARLRRCRRRFSAVLSGPVAAGPSGGGTDPSAGGIEVKRRDFLKSACTAPAVCSETALASGEGGALPRVAGEFGVVVCGGGPAGVCAAIASARRGAKTALIEKNGCLGGTWTSGLLCWMLDGKNKTGIAKEIRSGLIERGGGFPGRGGNDALAFDAEVMKALLEELCGDAGVHVRLHTFVVDAKTDADGAKAAVTESKSGRELWGARQFVDCTGDGDFAARAGCGFDLGREGRRVYPAHESPRGGDGRAV